MFIRPLPHAAHKERGRGEYLIVQDAFHMQEKLRRFHIAIKLDSSFDVLLKNVSSAKDLIISDIGLAFCGLIFDSQVSILPLALFLVLLVLLLLLSLSPFCELLGNHIFYGMDFGRSRARVGGG